MSRFQFCMVMSHLCIIASMVANVALVCVIWLLLSFVWAIGWMIAGDK
jgi:hypothetical protein